ncbi:MAG: YdeI/OmpD-associated family protein [Flavobacteriales bacterium]|nr:YdeI/OmpD-associated family protein [Flavobacteriales bacterium]
MKFTTQLAKDDNSDLYHWFFSVPNEVAEPFIEGNDRRVITKVNGTVKYHCAIYGDGAGGFRILLNSERVKKLRLVRGETITVELEKDRSEYGVPMSEELREVLDQNPEADELFHRLTKGAQRTLIYWSDNVKSSDIKIRRAIVMTDHLVNQGGKPDFKLLNVEMKEANQAAKRL